MLVVSSVDPVNIFPAVASDVLRKLCVQELLTIFGVLATQSCMRDREDGMQGAEAVLLIITVEQVCAQRS